MGIFDLPSGILCSDGLFFIFPYSLVESSSLVWVSYSFVGDDDFVLLLRGDGLLWLDFLV